MKNNIMFKNVKLPFNPLPYFYGLSFISISLLIYVTLISKSNNQPIIIIGALILIITYNLYKEKCPKCNSFYTIEENEEKEEDLGTKLKNYTYYTKKYYKKDEEGNKELFNVESSKKTIKRKEQQYKIFKICGNCDYEVKPYIKKNWIGEEPKYKIVKGNKEHYKKDTRVNIPAEIDRKVRDRAEAKCQVCGEITGLDIHHINHKNWDSKRLDNLILLCKKHHNLADKGALSKKDLNYYKNKKVKKNKTINIYKRKK
jgi:hypothetical protein